MSYCTFSSDDHKSDVNVFSIETGWKIHVCNGKSYDLETLQNLKDKLLELRTLGFHVPEHVFSTIEEEMN